jgi:hypothetical protein
LPFREPMSLRPSSLLTLVTALSLLGSGCAPGMLDDQPYPVGGPAGMSTEAWAHALAAHNRASLLGQTRTSRLVVIDYSLPATARRLWVVDIASGAVLMHEYVAHGVGSGGIMAYAFSNREGSNQSSLGAFVTTNVYVGIRGLSLRLKGLEPGINDRALARGIVIHGTTGVSESRARNGTMGRTNGCPAVSFAVSRQLIQMVQGGVVVFAWYPDRSFLARSDYLDRGAAAIRLSASD